MSHPYYHALSSAKKFGGSYESYLEIHQWFDSSKSSLPHFFHRCMKHHAEGIFECERVFGVTITNSLGKEVPVRAIASQHVEEDLGFIPTFAQWMQNMSAKSWMCRGSKEMKKLIEEENAK